MIAPSELLRETARGSSRPSSRRSACSASRPCHARAWRCGPCCGSCGCSCGACGSPRWRPRRCSGSGSRGRWRRIATPRSGSRCSSGGRCFRSCRPAGSCSSRGAASDGPARRYAPILTRLDRLVLRTLVINGVFVGSMLLFARTTALEAVTQRGDWMFDGHNGTAAEDVPRLAAPARRSPRESHTHAQQFRRRATSRRRPRRPRAADETKATECRARERLAAGARGRSGGHQHARSPRRRRSRASAHTCANTSRIPRARAKAIHDYVVLRLSPTTRTRSDKIMDEGGRYLRREDAEAVFAARTGVCEGYARLMVALGKAADVEIAYVTGSIRDARRRVAEGDDASVKAALEGYEPRLECGEARRPVAADSMPRGMTRSVRARRP